MRGAGCGNPIKDDDFDACLISKFMLVNHADVLKRNEFDRRMKQNGAKYDPGTLAERKSRYDDEFAQMAGHITRDTCLSVEMGPHRSILWSQDAFKMSSKS